MLVLNPALSFSVLESERGGRGSQIGRYFTTYLLYIDYYGRLLLSTLSREATEAQMWDVGVNSPLIFVFLIAVKVVGVTG